MAFKQAAVLLASLAAAGCREGAEVTLTRDPRGGLTVGVDKAGGGDACLTDASIAEPGSKPDTQPAWAVGRADLRACAHVFRVGGVTPGFEQRTTAPIAPGRSYCVAVSGPGFSDARPFVLKRDGRIRWLQRGPQDGC